MAVGNPVLVPPTAAAGSTVQLITFASGGTPPFGYSIDLRSGKPEVDALLQDVAGGTSDDGRIVQDLLIPAQATEGEVEIDLSVFDAKGRVSGFKGIELPLQPAQAPAADDPGTSDQAGPATSGEVE